EIQHPTNSTHESRTPERPRSPHHEQAQAPRRRDPHNHRPGQLARTIHPPRGRDPQRRAPQRAWRPKHTPCTARRAGRTQRSHDTDHACAYADWKCHPCPSSRERFLTCHDLSIVAHSSTRALPVVPCDNVHADETPATIAVRCVV